MLGGRKRAPRAYPSVGAARQYLDRVWPEDFVSPGRRATPFQRNRWAMRSTITPGPGTVGLGFVRIVGDEKGKGRTLRIIAIWSITNLSCNGSLSLHLPFEVRILEMFINIEHASYVNKMLAPTILFTYSLCSILMNDEIK
jgi:hypothetical protein